MNFPKLFKPSWNTEDYHKISERNNRIYYRFIEKNASVKTLSKDYGISESMVRQIVSKGSRIVIKKHKESKVAENFL